MSFSHFFIRRPVFAGVLSILIVIVGTLSLLRLPVSEYPEIIPPSVVVLTHFADGRLIVDFNMAIALLTEHLMIGARL